MLVAKCEWAVFTKTKTDLWFDCRVELMQLKLIILFAAFGTTESSNHSREHCPLLLLVPGGGGYCHIWAI